MINKKIGLLKNLKKYKICKIKKLMDYHSFIYLLKNLCFYGIYIILLEEKEKMYFVLKLIQECFKY